MYTNKVRNVVQNWSPVSFEKFKGNQVAV